MSMYLYFMVKINKSASSALRLPKLAGLGSRGSSLLTCVVMLGAVAEVRLVLQDELGQCESLGHLDWSVLLPLEDQVIHCVTNCGGTNGSDHNELNHRLLRTRIIFSRFITDALLLPRTKQLLC